MFVLTADQIGSRGRDDLTGEIVADGAAWHGRGAVLGPDRTAGDEFQLVFDDAAAALDAVLRLTRAGCWHVGVGVGGVDTPLPSTTGAARGAAFAAARDAVDAAKRSPHHVVVAAANSGAAADVTALLHLLLDVRERRSPEGWRVADLAGEGLAQTAIAEREGVTPQAVSQRARAGGIRLERAALPALARLLGDLDRPRSLPG